MSRRLTMDNPSKNHINKKKQILSAAKKEFAEKGFDGARMDSIAQKAEVNKALLHYHYSSKENLYKEVLVQETIFVAELMDKFKYMYPKKLTPPEKLYMGIYLLVNMHFESMGIDFRKIVSREMSEERDYFKQMIRDYLIPRLEGFEKIIIEGVEQGYFATKNPLYVVLGLIPFIMNSINSRNLLEGAKWYERFFGEQYKEEILEFLLDHTFKGLKPNGKELEIPKLSEEVCQAMHKTIEEVRGSYEY